MDVLDVAEVVRPQGKGLVDAVLDHRVVRGWMGLEPGLVRLVHGDTGSVRFRELGYILVIVKVLAKLCIEVVHTDVCIDILVGLQVHVHILLLVMSVVGLAIVQH